jgi:hypothetical protein
MATWATFAAAQPELAARGEQLLMLNNAAAPTPAGLAYLATVRADGGPRIHPISPALIEGRLYAFIIRASPKCRDLHRTGQYALHNYPHFVEPMSWDNCTDEEFYLSGRATLILDPALRQTAAALVGDALDNGDLFELDIAHVMHKTRPAGKLTYTKWRDGA